MRRKYNKFLPVFVILDQIYQDFSKSNKRSSNMAEKKSCKS